MDWLTEFFTPDTIAAGALLVALFLQHKASSRRDSDHSTAMTAKDKEHNETVVKVIGLLQDQSATHDRMTDVLTRIVQDLRNRRNG